MTTLLSYVPLFIGFIFMLAGIPAFLKLYEITQSLSTSVLLTIVYEVFVLIISLFAKIWRGMEKRWVERLTDHFDLTLQALFSGYQKRYLEYLIYQHRTFDVKGLSTQGPYNLELENVYVQLDVDPSPIGDVSTNPLKNLPENLRSGSHTIWQYISGKNTTRHNFVVLGAPGCGKTTLLKHVAISLAAPKRIRKKMGVPNLLPLLLFLRDHAETIKNNPSTPLAQLIRDQFENRQAPIPPSGWLEKKLENGKCLIMMDGLDEVADINTRKQVVAWVDQCMVSYGKNHFILTSRPHGYRQNHLEHATAVLRVRPFTNKQVEIFIHNWYLANEIMSSQKNDPGVREEARRGANDLLERIRSANNLSDLTINPLLLTMITTVHRFRSSLPGRRVELYAEICEVFLGKRQQARGLLLDLTPAQKTRVLRQLAYYMMEKERRSIDKDEATRVIAKPLSAVSPKTSAIQFLTDVENTSGLLIEFESGSYSFSHLTFQEYLASIHVIESRLEKELLKQVQNSWWHETIRLYCAQTDASNVIESCLHSSNASALSLAIECMDEAREVSSEIRAHYEDVMEKGVEDPDPERRKLIATAWLKKRTG